MNKSQFSMIEEESEEERLSQVKEDEQMRGISEEQRNEEQDNEEQPAEE